MINDSPIAGKDCIFIPGASCFLSPILMVVIGLSEVLLNVISIDVILGENIETVRVNR